MHSTEMVVLLSGVVELALGCAIIFSRKSWLLILCLVTAAFFLAVFPGNLWQYFEGKDAFGRDSDAPRLMRLLFLPLHIVWVL